MDCIEELLNTLEQDTHENESENSINNSSSWVRSASVPENDDLEIAKNKPQKFSEYGFSIHKKLKEHAEAEYKTVANVRVDGGSTWKSKSSKCDSLSCKTTVAEKPDVYAEPIFGLRLLNPLVSSKFIQLKMAGRLPVSMANIKTHLRAGDVNADWVIAGAIVFKSGLKTSQKGSQYCMWKISDLKNDLKQVSIFLFSKSSCDLWKLALGTVIAVLNPTTFQNQEENVKSDEIVLTIKHPDQVMVWGMSKDFGICKAKKKNGDNCTCFVNKSSCEFCVFHVKSEYNKFASRRAELQSPSGLSAIRNKVLGKNEVFNGGKSYTALRPAKKTSKQKARDAQLMTQLLTPPPSKVGSSTSKSDAAKLAMLKGSDAAGVKKPDDVQRGEGNAVVPRSRLEQIKMASERIKTTPCQSSSPNINRKSLISFSEFFKNNGRIDLEGSTTDTPLSRRDTSKASFSTESEQERTDDNSKERQAALSIKNYETVDILMPLKQSNGFVNQDSKQSPILSSSFSRTLTNSSFSVHKIKSALAKKKAIDTIMKKGGIKKTNPNRVKSANSSKISEKHKRPAVDEVQQKEEASDNKSVLSKRFIELMEQSSRHQNLADLTEDMERQNYFDKMEKKEQLESKMLTTYKVPCKAVSCQQCKYKWFSASELCKTEKHTLKIVDSYKRFFKCHKCSNRTVALEILPSLACKQCGSSSWQRAPMIKEKMTQIGDHLSIRGDEEKCFNSMKSSNINLLVPS